MIAVRLLGAFQFENVEPSWAWLWILGILGGVAVLVGTYWGIFRRSERRLTWALMVLRGGGLAALLLALAKPSWTGETQLTDAGRVAVILDDSESMSLADPSGKSRYALAVEAVERLRKALEAHPSGTPVVVDLFDIIGTPLPKNRPPEKPTVPRTDLVLALSNTVSGMRVKHLNGVVLISDGVDNARQQDFAEFAQGFGVPIFTAGFKEDRALGDLDLAIRPLRQPPERVMVNNDVKVEVVVTKTGGPKTSATVVIKRGLDERFVQKKLSLPAGNDERPVSLTLRPSQAGTFEFTAAAESDKGEQNLANNSWRFPLRVDAEPIRVLYLEGFLRPEFTFLKRQLEQDPDLNVAAVVRRVNPDRGEGGGKDVLTRDQLKTFDVVILGDMEAGYLSPREYDALAAWLDEKDKRRGTEHALLVLGGPLSFGPRGFRRTRLAEVLPVVFADRPPYDNDQPFRLGLTEEGRAHPMFQMADDRVKTEETWREAPRLGGASVVKKAKPAAHVLAVNPALRVGGKPAVVAAVQRYGAGHTMVLTANTTWYWTRFPRILGRSDTLYARFWSQAVRWLAGRSSDDRRPPLAVHTDKLSYDAGKPVRVTVERSPRPGDDWTGARLTVTYRAVGKGGRPVSVPVRSSSARPDVFTGTFFPAAAQPGAGGRFEVNAALTRGGSEIANRATEFLVHGSNQELLHTGTNPEALRELSRASGGVYRDVAEVEELAKHIPRKERRIVQARHVEYWNSPLLFVVFIGAVSAEWLVRRRSHLI
jgi:hypothetical protein